MLQIKLTEVAGGWILERLGQQLLNEPATRVFTDREKLFSYLERIIREN